MNPKIPNTREIRKVPCVACKGVGHSWEDGKKPCERCASKGWVEEVPGEETVCPQCHGDGVAPAKIKHECKECDGKGYAVRIIELVPHRITCDVCIKIGEQFVWDDCDRCKGTGFIDTFDGNEVVCSYCSGKAFCNDRITCKKCGGEGYTTMIEEVDVTPLLKENG